MRSSSFELKIFEDAAAFKKAIENKNNKDGLSRIVSTFDYLHKKDKKTYIVDEEGINMPWNSTVHSHLVCKFHSFRIILIDDFFEQSIVPITFNL